MTRLRQTGNSSLCFGKCVSVGSCSVNSSSYLTPLTMPLYPVGTFGGPTIGVGVKLTLRSDISISRFFLSAWDDHANSYWR